MVRKRSVERLGKWVAKEVDRAFPRRTGLNRTMNKPQQQQEVVDSTETLNLMRLNLQRRKSTVNKNESEKEAQRSFREMVGLAGLLSGIRYPGNRVYAEIIAPNLIKSDFDSLIDTARRYLLKPPKSNDYLLIKRRNHIQLDPVSGYILVFDSMDVAHDYVNTLAEYALQSRGGFLKSYRSSNDSRMKLINNTRNFIGVTPTMLLKGNPIKFYTAENKDIYLAPELVDLIYGDKDSGPGKMCIFSCLPANLSENRLYTMLKNYDLVTDPNRAVEKIKTFPNEFPSTFLVRTQSERAAYFLYRKFHMHHMRWETRWTHPVSVEIIR